jgi:hypothetical protein
MSRRDLYHELVRKALEADGWTITHDPYPLRFGEHNLFVDLGAEAPLAAEKAGRRIAVEVKSFLGTSPMTDLERAIGQFRFYRFLLRQEEPERQLFLAIPEEVYQEHFNVALGRDLIVEESMRLLVFDPAQEVLKRWIE